MEPLDSSFSDESEHSINSFKEHPQHFGHNGNPRRFIYDLKGVLDPKYIR